MSANAWHYVSSRDVKLVDKARFYCVRCGCPLSFYAESPNWNTSPEQELNTLQCGGATCQTVRP